MIQTVDFDVNNSMLANAIAFASMKHIAQVDKGGKPYIMHPLRMAMRLRTNNEELMCIAILHDVKEDQGVTDSDLYLIGMSPLVVKSINLLTHDKEKDTYEQFIEGLRGSLFALLVKYQDLKDNSDLSRTKGVREKDFLRMEKYVKAFLRVEGMIRELGYAI